MTMTLPNPFKAFSLTALLCLLAMSGCARDPALQVVRNTTSESILPLHRDFASTARQLSDDTRKFCAREGSEADFQALRQQWREVVSRWSGIQVFQMGPITEDNRGWRLQFWPDLKDQTARKLIQLLNSEQPISVDTIHDASVIIQGLSALEVLLFDQQWGQVQKYTQQTPLAQRQCQLLQAVALNSANVARDIWHGWQPEAGNFAGLLTQPGEENLQFPDSNSALAALVDTLVFTVEQIKIKKLNRPLGLDEGSSGNPYRLEWWRSGSAEAAIDANLQAMQALFNAGDQFGLSEYLNTLPGGAELGGRINTSLAQARQDLSQLPAPLMVLAKSGERPDALLKLYNHLQTLEQLLGESLPELLGITLSFNANDGD